MRHCSRWKSWGLIIPLTSAAVAAAAEKSNSQNGKRATVAIATVWFPPPISPPPSRIRSCAPSGSGARSPRWWSGLWRQRISWALWRARACPVFFQKWRQTQSLLGFPYLCERAKCALIICCPPFLGVVFDCVKIRCSSPSDSVDVKPIARLTLGSVRFLPFFRRVTTTGVCVSSYTANDLLCVLRDGPIKNHPTDTKNKKKKRESFPGARELQVCALV